MIFILNILFFFFSHQALSFSIISDFDETIKITQSGKNPIDLWGDSLFSGMIQFFQESSIEVQDLYVLSASPHFLKAHIDFLLKDINPREIILRKNVLESKFSYKLRNILRILNSTSENYILLGDDLGQDPEVYAHVRNLFPERILAIYIRPVQGRHLPPGLLSFYTAFDLALKEYEFQRMNFQSVEALYFHLMDEDQMDLIFPPRAVCPKVEEEWKWQYETDFSQKAKSLGKRLTKYCLSL